MADAKISKKALAGVAIAGLIGGSIGGFIADKDNNDNGLTKEQVQTMLDNLDTGLTEEQAKLIWDEQFGNDLSEILKEIREEDNWKDAALVLLDEELRDDDFQDFLNDNGYDIEDDQDVLSWRIKDIDWGSIDADRKDASFTVEYRVRYFEDGDEDEKHTITVYADVNIEEGEVEDIDFYLDEEE